MRTRLPSCILRDRAGKTAHVPVLRPSLEGRVPALSLLCRMVCVSTVESVWTFQLQGWQDTKMGLER